MKILAASVGHDSSVCFLENGNISFHMEEEKTTYNKKDPFPMYVFKDLRKYIKGEIDYYIITHLNLPKLNPFVELFEKLPSLLYLLQTSEDKPFQRYC